MLRSRARSLALLALLSCGGVDAALAQGALTPIQPAPQLFAGPRELQLVVLVNGESSGYFESFTYDPATNRLAARRRDLTQVSVRTPEGPPEERIFLDTLPGTYRYDAAMQRIDFILTDEQRLPRVYNAIGEQERPKPQANIGAIVNYSVLGGSVRDRATGLTTFNDTNVMFDARAFSQWGVLTQTGLAGGNYFNQNSNYYNNNHNQRFQRYDTSYVFDDPESTLTYRLGDTMSGGTAWSRPIRMGGAQVMRDFTLRSDIITRPMPGISGTAAAPSTVDVLVNGVRTYSQSVGAGPYSITNLPIIAAGGNAQVVIRDSTGRVVEQSLSLFNPARMLAVSLSDFSVESGWARRSYGTTSDDYDRRPVFSGTYRYGLNEWMTLESHAEGGAGLVNAGAGVITGLGAWGTFNLAATGSHSPYGSGGQGYADWQTQLGRVSFSLGTQRSFSNYDDLASVTARLWQQAQYNSNPWLPGDPLLVSQPQTYLNVRPPRAIDRASVGFPLFDDRTSMSLGLVHLEQQDGTTSKLLTATVSRSFPWIQATFYASAYADRGANKSLGVSAGLSFPITDGLYGSVGANSGKTSRGSITADISKSQSQVDGSWGGHLRGGVGQNTYGQVDASYRSGYGQVSGSVIQDRNTTLATAQVDGSVAVMGGGVFMGNRVDSAFAVVDAGASDITVTQDNRAIGKTNFMGKFLVPNLRPWERNTLGIDPEGQSVTYDASKVAEVTAPRGNSGVYVNFGGRANVISGVVVFVGPDGKPLQAGYKGHLDGKSDTFLVGHDGRAYVKDLESSNVAIIDMLDKECRASFAFTPEPGRQGIVRGVLCQ